MTISSKKQIRTILENGYGVNSGVYSVIHPSIKMNMDEYGQYKAYFTEQLSGSDYIKLAKVDSMSDYSMNESQLAKKLYSNQNIEVMYDSVVGYYTSLYAGYVVEGEYRSKASSGGITSWILAELIKRKLVDGVIQMQAIDPLKNDGKLFKYVISTTDAKVRKNAKSKYYPGELSEVLKTVKNNPSKKYAVVGIPEFITEVRLLAEVDEQIKRQIAFTVGLVCGHQKTAKYAEALAWQQGIKPGDLQSVDFRIKQPDSTAIDYLHEFTGNIDGKKVTLLKEHKDLFCGSWANGFFKAKFSDYTDNVFNETADIVLGDAWLPEYNKDGMGNNIVIVRNAQIDEIIRSAHETGRLNLDNIDANAVKRSQAGLIHHCRDELPYRLTKAKSNRLWVPKKRYRKGRLPSVRREIQDLRYQMATTSHEVYRQAVERNDWSFFENTMLPTMNRYKYLYKINGSRDTQIKGVVVKKSLDTIRKVVRIRTRLRAVKHKIRIRTRYRQAIATRAYNKKQAIITNPDGVILTLTGYFNYGNIVQRFALQEFLQKKGLKYVSYERVPIKSKVALDKRFRFTKKFIDTYIVRKDYDRNELFPTYIVGSDQVWRNWNLPKEKGDLSYYFYDFLKGKKANRISYAASFGLDSLKDAEINPRLRKQITPLIKEFNSISVREESAIDIIKDNWSKEAQLVVDPTMLLTAFDYNKIINRSQEKLKPVNGVFAYIIAVNNEKQTIVDRIAKAMDAPKVHFYPKKQEVLPPVEQWLKGFRDADFAVTDSFHGTAFSIINNTPFIVIENEYGGNTRMKSILRTFGLEDRLVSEKEAEDFNVNALKEINWDEVNRKLATLRQDSGKWLLDAVDERPRHGK